MKMQHLSLLVIHPFGSWGFGKFSIALFVFCCWFYFFNLFYRNTGKKNPKNKKLCKVFCLLQIETAKATLQKGMCCLGKCLTEKLRFALGVCSVSWYADTK